MRASLKVLTLAVRDLERSLAFYRDGFGLPTRGIIGTEFEDGAVVFLELSRGLVLALWTADSLAKDCSLAVTSNPGGAVSLGHITRTPEEVDEVMAQAEAAGARITDPPRERFWGGRSGYFQDPDGHLWEIAWNPQWSLEET